MSSNIKDQINGVEIDLFRSRPLDIHRYSESSFLLPIIEEVKNELDDPVFSRNNGTKLLRLLITDLYLCCISDPKSCLAVSRDNNAYIAGSRYNTLRIGRSLIIVLDKLINAGYVSQKIGFYDDTTNRGYTTRIWANTKLLSLFEKLDKSSFLCTYHPERETVILRNEDGDDIEYEDTDQTNKMRTFLKRYNEFISYCFIDIPTLKDVGIRIEKGGGEAWLPINQTPNFTRRIFNNSSFTQGGRFYGGWWQNCPREYREQIFIDDKATSEVDFKNNHIALLYAEKGIEWFGQEAYLVEQPRELSHITDYRTLVKNLLLIAINAEDENKAFAAFRQRATTGTVEKKLTNNQLRLVLDLLREKHKPIADKLASGAGIHLQYQDSQIAEKVVEKFLDNELPILVVHDSFIVPDGYERFLKSSMLEAFREVTGLKLTSMEEKTHHPELCLPENWDDWGMSYEAVAQAIEHRHNPPRSDRYLDLEAAFHKSLKARNSKQP